jgi:hypothetical protein
MKSLKNKDSNRLHNFHLFLLMEVKSLEVFLDAMWSVLNCNWIISFVNSYSNRSIMQKHHLETGSMWPEWML